MSATVQQVRDPAQIFTALDTGNRTRFARADFKRKLRLGVICPLAAIRDPPWYVQTMRAFELLEAAPHVGPMKTRHINMRLALGLPAVNLFTPVGELTEGQKEAIIKAAFPRGTGFAPNRR